jgi:hypothetical protein
VDVYGKSDTAGFGVVEVGISDIWSYVRFEVYVGNEGNVGQDERDMSGMAEMLA